MKPLRIHIEGVGIWSKQLANFAALQSLLVGQVPEPPPAKPAAATLPSNERRRAPESVLLAVEVAGQAVAMSGRDASSLTCVFSSSHGDQAITDYMCATLAHAPNELSPIRFHNSVHNAPAGYWTIATGCHEPSTAVCAHRLSFGAGLLEAISHALADNCPVLLVCSDIAGVYPLVEETGCTQSFGCALVLAPEAGETTLASLDVTLAPVSTADSRAVDSRPELLTDWRDANASAEALPLLTLLAQGIGRCQLAAANRLALQIVLQAPTRSAATPLPRTKLASPESADQEHVA
jgi:hypothetical protein